MVALKKLKGFESVERDDLTRRAKVKLVQWERNGVNIDVFPY